MLIREHISIVKTSAWNILEFFPIGHGLEVPDPTPIYSFPVPSVFSYLWSLCVPFVQWCVLDNCFPLHSKCYNCGFSRMSPTAVFVVIISLVHLKVVMSTFHFVMSFETSWFARSGKTYITISLIGSHFLKGIFCLLLKPLKLVIQFEFYKDSSKSFIVTSKPCNSRTTFWIISKIISWQEKSFCPNNIFHVYKNLETVHCDVYKNIYINKKRLIIF